MRKFLICLLCLAIALSCLCGCTGLDSSSTFSILFIDVEQGDAALVECDGCYMLIDGGPESAGDKVRQVLEERGIQHLNILAISHMHEDHIGGLAKALTYATKIDKTIANTDYASTEAFKNLEYELGMDGAKITVPNVGDKFKLGSAEIEVVDVSAESDNDSLVLMITYGETRFLFCGDIPDTAQTRISDKYQNDADESYKVDLIKMPHHGSASTTSIDGTGSLYRFIRTFMPTYAVISVGAGNQYGHPHQKTLDLLDDADVKVYRTDENGDITVKSNGETISIITSK